MKQIIADFFQLGHLRLFSRILTGLRGLFIISFLSPQSLGEYTIWLLFVVYFSLLDFNILYALERDIPFYRGQNNGEKVKEITITGRSTYFILTLLATVSLYVVSYFIYRDGMMSLLLSLYLLTDKICRIYDSCSRIESLYRANGLAELIKAVSSLVLILILLPRYGIYGIFLTFIGSSLLSIAYLYRKCLLEFSWYVNLKKQLAYIQGALSLAVVYYSYEIFQAVAITVLAWQWDKQTLGYFVFAFRVYQICLDIFPAVIADVLRTRLYFYAAQIKAMDDPFEKIYRPLKVYAMVAAFFWLIVYWWGNWGIQRFFPNYVQSTMALKLLMLALIPMGIVKVLSQYLCSSIFKRMPWIIMAWTASIFTQATLFFIFPLTSENITAMSSVIYLSSTFLIYISIGFCAFGFGLKEKFYNTISKMVSLLIPLSIILMVVGIIRFSGHWLPTGNFYMNILPFGLSVLGTGILMYFVYFFERPVNFKFSLFKRHIMI